MSDTVGPIHKAIAQAGDVDLDFYLDGCTITSVVVVGREVEAGIRGGHGYWISDAGPVRISPESKPVIQASLAYPSASEWLFSEVVSRLERWRDDASELLICMAPGRTTTLRRDRDDWLPLPRRWPPPMGALS